MASSDKFLFFNVILIWIITLKNTKALCPSGFTAYGSYCYGIDPNFIRSWAESELHCIGFGGHLTSINNLNELKFLEYFISNQKVTSKTALSDALWVGLHHPSPFGSPGQATFAYRQGWKWTDDSPYDDRDPWYDGLWEYNAPTDNQDCSIIGLSGNKLLGFLQDGPEFHHAICKVQATCPTAFHQFGKFCYMIDPDKAATRRLYQMHCESLGGELTSISSETELKFLDRKIRETFPNSWSNEKFWIGLQNPSLVQVQAQTTGARRYGWEWSDGSPYNTSLEVVWDWAEPGVGERYTYLQNYLWFGTLEVEERLKGICKVEVARVSVTLPTTSTTQVRTTITTTEATTTTTKQTTSTIATASTATSTLTTTTAYPTTTTTTAATTISTSPSIPTTTTTKATSPTIPTTTETTSTTLKTTPSQPPTRLPGVLSSFVSTKGTRFVPIITSTVTYPTFKQTSTAAYPQIKTTPSNNSSKNAGDENNSNKNSGDGNNTNNSIKNNNNNNNTIHDAGSSGSKKFSSYAPAFVAAPIFVLLIIIIITLSRKGYVCCGGPGQASPAAKRQRINSSQRDTTIQVDNLGYYLSYPGLSIVEKEYKSIPGTFSYPNHIARWQPAKNTFKTYIPYDDNRVTLEQQEGNPNSDYINASFIKGFCSAHKTYIAAQGPRENTVLDFWRMVWEKAVTVIVMLTSPAESGRGKCLVYWPIKEGESTKYGDIKVMLDRQHVFADDTVRIFFIKKGNQSRRVTQFYFHSWPDSGPPTHPVTLLNFRRKIKKQVISDSAPVLIHCSSGVGRTGTFIAIDYLLDQAAIERVVDIYRCVTKLRKQRPWMVSNVKEYKCVYHSVYEGVTTGSTTVSSAQFYNTYRLLTTHQQEVGGATSLQQQFKTIKSIEAEMKLLGKIDTIRALMRGIGKSSKKAEKTVETFIRLDGFNKPNSFILTWAPLVTRIDTFWNTVYERKCKAVVMLCPRENIPFIQTYFPDEEEATFPSPPLTIECLSVKEDGSQFPVIAKEMKIEARGKPRHNFCHISVKSDLARLPVPSQAAILVYLRNLSLRRCHDPKTNTRFPMLVHCLNGSDWSGVFYVLCYVLEQLEVDKEVNIFQAVRQVRHLYPHLLQTEEQYLLLYEAVASHIQRNQSNNYSC